MSRLRITPMGDACLSVAFDERVDPVVNAQCVALARAFERLGLPGVRDVVSGFHTVAVFFDPLQITHEELISGLVDSSGIAEPSIQPSRLIEVPVTYGGQSGPDLDAVAAFGGVSAADAVALHTSVSYTVYMLGFLPGFAYLGTVDSRIAMPRLGTPRPRVAAGSVGIAGLQTGIYPCDTPGGWRIIGRTSLPIFDPSQPEPSMFRAGDRVKFVAI